MKLKNAQNYPFKSPTLGKYSFGGQCWPVFCSSNVETLVLFSSISIYLKATITIWQTTIHTVRKAILQIFQNNGYLPLLARCESGGKIDFNLKNQIYNKSHPCNNISVIDKAICNLQIF